MTIKFIYEFSSYRDLHTFDGDLPEAPSDLELSAPWPGSPATARWATASASTACLWLVFKNDHRYIYIYILLLYIAIYI